ncbi:MAG: ABC transporter permease [Corynebacterium sp.]|uniref:ABC transporter permease n=1 Tax=Corynebacterium sp. TaxID=1720 RepID=UPI0026DF9EAE|nr:ABC transporter permease [Corynebacterium sp.]MDO5669330.1 ABC transporter permease [Corynebacterium sp.]
MSTLTRTRSLARAEGLQFTRNRTIVGMAIIMPLLFPLAMFFLYLRIDTPWMATASALEVFLAFALLFVQFYAVLSMATTRRDEKVLKRLRTGEATDREILVSLCLPGAVLLLVMSIIFTVVLLATGAPLPVNPLPVVVALVLGIVLSSALALLTSAFTSNAEAAQVTSMPVFLLVLGSMSAFRFLIEGPAAAVIDRTPFALILDLAQQGWLGAFSPDSPVLSAGEVFAMSWQKMLLLTLWTMVAVWAANRYMRWDSHR